MAQQIINTGSVANDGTGDPLRVAWTKANANFTELFETKLSGTVSTVGYTGNYTDLNNKPVLGTASQQDTSYFALSSQVAPAGGSTNQVLAKASESDFDFKWSTVSGGEGGGISDGDKGDVVVSSGGDVWTLTAQAEAKFAAEDHNHTGVYSAFGHTHLWEDIDDAPEITSGDADNILSAGSDGGSYLAASSITLDNLEDGDKGDITIESGVWKINDSYGQQFEPIREPYAFTEGNFIVGGPNGEISEATTVEALIKITDSISKTNTSVTGDYTLPISIDTDMYRLTLTGNTTFSGVSVSPNPVAREVIVVVEQDATGGRTFTVDAGINTPSAGIIIDTDANAITVLSLLMVDLDSGLELYLYNRGL